MKLIRRKYISISEVISLSYTNIRLSWKGKLPTSHANIHWSKKLQIKTH